MGEIYIQEDTEQDRADKARYLKISKMINNSAIQDKISEEDMAWYAERLNESVAYAIWKKSRSPEGRKEAEEKRRENIITFLTTVGVAIFFLLAIMYG